ncbi:MAG: hypothetical protein GY853_16695 [PVC group bacterium]|nr:hypothetical protein [PVC group bacterium]
MEKFTLVLDEQAVNIILTALGELPAKISMNLITNIQKECQRQVQEESKKEDD